MQTILTLCNNSSNAGMDRIRWKHAGKMSVSAEGNKERLIRGDTFELKLEKMSGNLSSRQEESRRHSRQAEAGTRRAEGIQAGGGRYPPRGQDRKSGVYSQHPWSSDQRSIKHKRETGDSKRGGWVGRTTP